MAYWKKEKLRVAYPEFEHLTDILVEKDAPWWDVMAEVEKIWGVFPTHSDADGTLTVYLDR